MSSSSSSSIVEGFDRLNGLWLPVSTVLAKIGEGESLELIQSMQFQHNGPQGNETVVTSLASAKQGAPSIIYFGTWQVRTVGETCSAAPDKSIIRTCTQADIYHLAMSLTPMVGNQNVTYGLEALISHPKDVGACQPSFNFAVLEETNENGEMQLTGQSGVFQRSADENASINSILLAASDTLLAASEPLVIGNGDGYSASHDGHSPNGLGTPVLDQISLSTSQSFALAAGAASSSNLYSPKTQEGNFSGIVSPRRQQQTPQQPSRHPQYDPPDYPTEEGFN